MVVGEIVAADDDMDIPGASGQEDRPLPGRITTADQDDVAANAKFRLHRGRAVEDSAALEPLDAGTSSRR